MVKQAVDIVGDGIAACCCQFLLNDGGSEVRLTANSRTRVPAIMLSAASQALLTDVFRRPDLFEGLWRIRRRIVAWGDAALVNLPHQALVVSEDELLVRLARNSSAPASPGLIGPSWRIHASGPLPDGSQMQVFGSRLATASEVQLDGKADAEACLMESVGGGWLFLLPVSSGKAWLLTAGDDTNSLLAESRLVRKSVGEILSTAGSFPSSPRIADPFCGEGWLACGSAAVGFDPLCGDGTAHAVREGILACAVIRAAAAEPEIVSEYRLRVLAGFQRHLTLCQQFYSTGGTSEWWRTERKLLLEGRAWVAKQDTNARLGKYRLNGFSLERRIAAAH